MSSSGNPENDHLSTEALRLLIENEQKLLAAFDARQASADARMTASLTGALALPVATVALAKTQTDEGTFQCLYAVVVGLVCAAVLIRACVGFKYRKESSGHGRRWSSESIEAATARGHWWGTENDTDPGEVSRRARELWRSRAQNSREIAQIKDIASIAAAVALVAALVVSVILVFGADFWRDAP